MLRVVNPVYRGITTLNLRALSTTSKAVKPSKFQEMLTKRNNLKKNSLKAPVLSSPTSNIVLDGTTGTVSKKAFPKTAPPKGDWGIQMVLNYLKTQKISKCVVFDSFSQSIHSDYIIICNLPSVRAMASLGEKLVKMAVLYQAEGYETMGYGKSDDLWNSIELKSIVVHCLTDVGRATPGFQRFERRLLNEATLVPVTEWHTLQDAWVRREANIIENPPTPFKSKSDPLPPPGYYMRPTRPAVLSRNQIDKDDDIGEFNYYDMDEQHKAKIEAMRNGETGEGVYTKEYIEFIDVEGSIKNHTEEDETIVKSHTTTKKMSFGLYDDIDECSDFSDMDTVFDVTDSGNEVQYKYKGDVDEDEEDLLLHIQKLNHNNHFNSQIDDYDVAKDKIIDDILENIVE